MVLRKGFAKGYGLYRKTQKGAENEEVNSGCKTSRFSCKGDFSKCREDIGDYRAVTLCF